MLQTSPKGRGNRQRKELRDMALHILVGISIVNGECFCLCVYLFMYVISLSSFHVGELNEKRSPQGRVTLYPFASTPELAGLGITGFGSYGYTNVGPDTKDAVLRWLAGLVHYSSKH